MPGIYGTASALPVRLGEISDRMFAEVSSCRNMSRFVTRGVSAPGFAGFLMTNKMFVDSKRPYEDDGLIVLADGNIFNLDELGLPEASCAEAAAKLYRERGEMFAAALRGHFVIALLDKREGVLRLYADPAGTKPLYYMHHGGALYFSSELKALLPVGPVPKRLDARALNNVMLQGYVLSHRTLVEEVSWLKSAGLLKYDIKADRLTASAYYDHSYYPRELDEKENIERIEESLQKAFERVIRHTLRFGFKPLITVTGGLDSRAIAVAARRLDSARIYGFTHRFHDKYEVDYARRICRALEMGHLTANLERSSLLRETLDEAVVAGEAMVHFNDVWRFVASMRKLEADDFGIMHTGIPGSVIMGIFIPPLAPGGREWQVKANDRPANKLLHGLGDWAERTYWTMAWAWAQKPGKNILDPAGIPRLANSLSYNINPSAAALFVQTVAGGVDHWRMIQQDIEEMLGDWKGSEEYALQRERVVLCTRQTRGVCGAFRGIEERMDFSAPFWDLDLVRCMLETPVAVKKVGNAYYGLLKKRFLPRALARIPNTRAFGPMRNSQALWWLESRWKRRFFRGVLGKFNKDYRRLYGCSYQHVIRYDTAIREFVADRLRDFDELEVCGVDVNKWKRLIDEWRRDPRPHLLLTRHFFWLLYLKRWLELWGKYVSTA